MSKYYIISRTDAIGDTVLTLPMAGILKTVFPGCRISFLGNSYTKDIVSCSKYIDSFIDWFSISNLPEKEKILYFKKLQADTIIHVFPKKEIAALAKKSGIPERIGTTNRLFHWATCNKLIRLSRKNSPLHEAQLNIKLLKPFGITDNYNLTELTDFYGLKPEGSLPKEIVALIDIQRFNIILHPKSKGSAREWGIDHFEHLIRLLPPDRFNIFLTGTEPEGEAFRSKLIKPFPFAHDLSGKLSLSELILFIDKIDGLVACSTGPLHIAAALGKYALGIYPPIRPMHPGRWAPVGIHAEVFVENKECNVCRKKTICNCIKNIKPEDIATRLTAIAKLVREKR